MNEKLKSLLALACLSFLVACASGPSGPQRGGEAAPQGAVAGDEATSSVKRDVKAPGLLNSQDVSRGRKLPQRYQRFEAALRAMDERVLLEEAGKFLGQDENDLIILNGLGIYHFRSGKPEAARIFWERGLEGHKDHPALLNNLAVLEVGAGQETVALEYLRTAYRKDPRHFEVLMNLGTLHLQGGQFPRAKDFFEQAAKMRKSPSVQRQLAVAYHLNGDFRKAKSLYESVLKEDMRNVELMFNYATLLVEHTNDMAEAKVWLNRINFLGSDDPDLLRKVERLHEKTL